MTRRIRSCRLAADDYHMSVYDELAKYHLYKDYVWECVLCPNTFHTMYYQMTMLLTLEDEVYLSIKYGGVTFHDR